MSVRVVVVVGVVVVVVGVVVVEISQFIQAKQPSESKITSQSGGHVIHSQVVVGVVVIVPVDVSMRAA